MRALLAALALASGCAKSIDDLSPISCAQNGLCPDSYACVDAQCMRSEPCAVREPASCTDTARPRCTLLRSAVDAYAAECVPQHAGGAEGTVCQMTFSVYEVNFGSGTFPWSDISCAAGTFCYDYTLGDFGQGTGTAPGSCRRFCARDADCGATQKCLDAFGTRYLPGYKGPAVPAGVCVSSCTLFASGACTGGLECVPALDIDGVSAFGSCRASGILAEGDPCSLASACGTGLACVPDGSRLACRKLCKPGGTPSCTTPQTCNTTVVQMSGAGVCK